MNAVLELKVRAAAALPGPLKTVKALAAKIDRLGELKDALEAVKPLQTEFEALKKELVAEFTPQGDEAAELSVKGRRYTLVLGARCTERSISDIKDLLDCVGLQRFLGLVRPVLTAVDKTLASHEKARLIQAAPGERRLKTVLRA